MLHIAKNTPEPTEAKAGHSGEKGGVGGQSIQADNTGRVSSMHLEDPSKGETVDTDASPMARTRNRVAASPGCRANAHFFPLQPYGDKRRPCWA